MQEAHFLSSKRHKTDSVCLLALPPIFPFFFHSPLWPTALSIETTHIKEQKSKQRFIQKAFLSFSLSLSVSPFRELVLRIPKSNAAFDPYHKVLFNLPISCTVGWEWWRPSFSWTYGKNALSTLRFDWYTVLGLISENLQTLNIVQNYFLARRLVLC